MMADKLFTLLGRVAKWFYFVKDDNLTFKKYLYFFFYQKFLRFNAHVPWPVHYTSYVNGVKNIKLNGRSSPGSSPFQYISGSNGLIMGNNVFMAPGVQVITANHNFTDYRKAIPCRPVEIGSNVWIGAHVVILPEVHIGDNVIIGAGSIVTKDIPSNVIAVGNPCKVLKNKEAYNED